MLPSAMTKSLTESRIGHVPSETVGARTLDCGRGDTAMPVRVM